MSSDFETFSSLFTTIKHQKYVMPFLNHVKCYFPHPDLINNNDPVGYSKICAFYLEYDCVNPFVKLICQVDDNKATFPTYEFDSDSGENSYTDLETNIAQIYFQGTIKDDLHHSFRGFIPGENVSYVFYDFTRVFYHGAVLKPNFKFVTLFEFCNKDAVAGFTIQEKVQECMSLVTPKSSSYIPIEPPFTGYLCLLSDNKFVSLTEDEIKNISVATDALVNYKNKGHYYYFSDKILKPLPDKAYSRYAVFPMNKGQTYSDSYNSISIGKNIIGVKSPDQFIVL